MAKLSERCFCCFMAAMLVPLGRAPTWRFHTKLYKFRWNSFPNNARHQIRSLETQNVAYFALFTTWYGLGIVNPFRWIFNATSSEKSCLISMPFLWTYIDVRTVKFFPSAESWLVNSNFRRARRMQGICRSTLKLIGCCAFWLWVCML